MRRRQGEFQSETKEKIVAPPRQVEAMDASDVGSLMRDQTFDKALAVDLSPSGRFLIKDFYGVGGVPAGRGGAVLSRSHSGKARK